MSHPFVYIYVVHDSTPLPTHNPKFHQIQMMICDHCTHYKLPLLMSTRKWTYAFWQMPIFNFLSLYIYCNNFPRLSLAFHMFIFHSRTLTHPSKSSASRALDWITERRWPAKTYRKYKYSRHIYIHNNDAEHIYVRFMNIHIQDIYRFNEPKY